MRLLKKNLENKTKIDDRSKSALQEGVNESDKNYGQLYSHHRSSSRVRVVQPSDWLLEHKKKRDKLGGEYMYKEILPKQLGDDKISSYHDIKSKVLDIERKANKLEKDLLDSNNSKNIIRDVNKVGSMYADAIKAKIALIEQL